MIFLHVFLTILVNKLEGSSCFFCVSSDEHYNATVRRQLATQTDIFFYPISAKTSSCSEYIDENGETIVEGQICTKYSQCVTLFPNLPNSTFVIRGCFENVLRHSFREDEQLQRQGCYLVRSLPLFSNITPMDYIICTCDNGNYCNSMPITATVPRPYSFAKSNVLRLSSSDPQGPLQIVSAAALYAHHCVLPLFLCTFFVF